METFEPKKMALIRILQILQKYSDCDHPLKQEDIARYLDQEYGILIERKAVGRNLALLKDAGYEIESTRAGSWLAEREFTDSELRILIDGVLTSKYISARYSRDLIEKLCGLASRYFRSHVKHIHSVGEWAKSENPALFLNIETVDEAIEKKRQIRFDFNRYGPDKKLHVTHTHQVSPYLLVLHNQRYYLMGCNERWKDVAFYRLDRITDMTVTEEKLTPITSLEGHKQGINYKDLSTALPYMYNDPPVPVEFLAKDYVIDQAIDWFGRDIRISEAGEGQYRVTVRVSPNAMRHWAMQYAPHVKILSPRTLADAVKADLEEAVKVYSE